MKLVSGADPGETGERVVRGVAWCEFDRRALAGEE